MIPRREATSATTSGCLTEYTHTLNQLLDGSSRGSSWLSGGSASVTSRPRISPPCALNDDTTWQCNECQHNASISNQRKLPNHAPTIQASSNVSSTGPAQTPSPQQSPASVVVTDIGPPQGAVMPPIVDESRKRKLVNRSEEVTTSKRVSRDGNCGNSIAPGPRITTQAKTVQPIFRSRPTSLMTFASPIRPSAQARRTSDPLQSLHHPEPQVQSTGPTDRPLRQLQQVADPFARQDTSQQHLAQANAIQRSVVEPRAALTLSQTVNAHALPVIHPYSREYCEGTLEEYNQTSGPRSLVEQSRINLLLQAARSGDSLFMFVHQVVSRSAVDFNGLPGILRNSNGFFDCVELLSHLMAGEYIKITPLFEFFAVLPCSLAWLGTECPDNYQLLVNHVVHMSCVLPNGWQPLKQRCLQRGYPPLATELWVLNIYSPTLMEVFFLSVVRQIWPNDRQSYLSSTHDTAKQIFDETKSALYSSLIGWSLPAVILQNINVTFHRRYIMFTQQAASRAHNMRLVDQSIPISPFIGLVPSNRLNEDSPQVLATEPSPRQHRQYPRQQHLPARPHSAPFQPVLEHGLSEPTAGTSRTNQAVTAIYHTTALQQAHLRGSARELPPHPRLDLLYQSVTGFAFPPRRLNNHEPYQKYTFTLPQSVCVARTIDPQNGQRKVRQISEAVLQYRLRVVEVGKLPRDRREDLARDWSLKATSWPHNFSYRLNDDLLEVRHDSRHTKDLPVDITEYVKTGRNDIVVNSKEAASMPGLYALAVEIITATSHNAILESCLKRTICREDSVRAITHILQPCSSGGDDLIVGVARIYITIFDPISQSKICDLPARGVDCKHRECFDLLTFLQTRPREKPHWPSEADAWRCPICLADARPHRILIDGFLKEVGEKLVSEGKEKTRVIIVEADGRWGPKIEEHTEPKRSTTVPDQTRFSSPTATLATEGANAAMATGSGSAQVSEERQIIDLCEDD